MEITKSETEIWKGTYRGVDFEINHFRVIPNSIEPTNKNCWTHYIYLHLYRIPERYNPASFWLKGKKHGRHIIYEYNKHPIISRLEWHGGCTWYSKESGFDGAQKVIKIGCDYQHLWDKNQYYDLEYVKSEVEKTINSFLNYIPDYIYWSCYNGKIL